MPLKLSHCNLQERSIFAGRNLHVMEENSDYLAFLEWLQTTYPALYMACWKYLLEPPNGETVRIIKEGMDDQTYTALIDARFEYYHS